jgi:citrate lyase subunit beta/citryl-CoA lyase
MDMRSLLVAPGDDEGKLAAALTSEADAVVIDLDIMDGARVAARATAARILKAAPREKQPALMARISPLDSGETDADLDAVMAYAPFAILLPKCRGAACIQRLSTKLAVREASCGLKDGATRIVAAADSARGLLALGSLPGASARLAGLAWDAEAICADLGADRARDGAGVYAGPLRLARDMSLIAAAGASVVAIDTTFAGIPDLEGLRAEALAARRDGFAAKLAIDPAQAKIINAAFAAAAETG